MSEPASRRLYLSLLGFTLLLKFVWAAYLPLTGDEAYFTLWGKYPDLGYYDHPPMVGWWLSLLQLFGDATWWLRLPAVLLNTGIAYAIYRIIRQLADEDRALLGAALYLLLPLNLLNVLITTDTPLIAFSFLSAWAFWCALRNSSWRWYIASGLLLGAAFLAKYFAVLLGLSFGVYLLLFRRKRRDLLGLLWLFLAVLPFALLNVWWNSCNCWDNILFNVYNRHSGGDGNHTVTYLVMLLYMVTPPLFWYGWKVRWVLWQALRRGEPFIFLWVFPLMLFLLLSLQNRIGLHWVLAFYPFLFLALVPLLTLLALQRTVKFMLFFSLLHAAAVMVLVMVPIDHWKDRGAAYYGLLLGLHKDRFIQQFNSLPPGFVYATGSYVDSALLEHASGSRFIVFGDGSKYGRQDDLLTDWRALEGKNIAVLRTKKKTAEEYQEFFNSSQISEFEVMGTPFYLLEGRGFHYSIYREQMLTRLRDSYYRYPAFLPAGQCYFYRRYFPGEGIARLQQ
jgi:hypothetical protein